MQLLVRYIEHHLVPERDGKIPVWWDSYTELEDGSGAPYSLPSGSDEGTRKDTYFKVPFPAQAAVRARVPS